MINKIDETICLNCGLCEDICPMDIFRKKEDIIYIAYHEDCCSCMMCSRICPVDAITVSPELPRKYDGGYRWKKVKEMLNPA